MIRRALCVVCLALVCALLAPAPPAEAGRIHRSGTEMMVIYATDAAVARPFTLGLGLLGAAVWALTLPFTYASDDPTVFDVLVRNPLEATFTRCLGCRPGQTTRETIAVSVPGSEPAPGPAPMQLPGLPKSRVLGAAAPL